MEPRWRALELQHVFVLRQQMHGQTVPVIEAGLFIGKGQLQLIALIK